MKKGHAVCIGMNNFDPDHYGYEGELHICEKDAEDMYNLLLQNDFESIKLTTEEATRANVISAIQNSSKELKSGDIIVVYYSGHGGKVPDVKSEYDIEYDDIDETWCLYDAQLLDDELRNLWAGFDEGVRILLLSDSCHSGSIAKAPISSFDEIPEDENEYIEAKCISDKTAKETFESNETFYRKLAEEVNALPITKEPVKASLQQISGCEDYEYSYTGETNSAFTKSLREIWDDGTFEGDYQEFYTQIKETLSRQHPVLLKIGEENLEFEAEKPFEI